MDRQLPTLGVSSLREPGELAFEPRHLSLLETAIAAIVAALLAIGAVVF